MNSYEMVETLSEKAHVSLEQAKNALEKSNWDMLDAAIYLERTRDNMNPQAYQQAPGYQYVSSQMNSVGGQFRQPPFSPNAPFPPNPGYGAPPNVGKQPGFNPPPYGNPGFYGPPPFRNQYYNHRRNSVDEFLNKAGNRAEKVIGDGTSNFFVVRRQGNKIIQLPILLFIIMLLATLPVFPVVVFAFFIGLMFECKYSFEGLTSADTIRSNNENTNNFRPTGENIVKDSVNLNKSAAVSAQSSQSESDVPKAQSGIILDDKAAENEDQQNNSSDS